MKLKQEIVAPYLFISPFLISFAVFGLFPIGYSIFISFWKWTTNGPVEFVGVKNYVKLFTMDPFFIRTLVNSFIIMLGGSILQHLFALPLAMMLNDRKIKGKDFFRTAFFLPYITSTIAIVLIFSQLFDENYGWLNYIIVNLFHGEPYAWLTSPAGIRTSICIMINWQFVGWNTVIYIAGLQSIDNQLYEAAEIDGANKFQQHLFITIPNLSPVIFFALTLSIIGGFQIFDQPFILLSGYDLMGGVGNAGLTSALYLMATGFNFGRFGRASSIAWVMFFIIIAFTYITRKLIPKE